jgi:hypothetical protein
LVNWKKLLATAWQYTVEAPYTTLTAPMTSEWAATPSLSTVRGTPLDLSSFLFLTPFSLYSYSLILPVYIFTGS